MKKFVINLKRRPDRLDAFNRQCPFNDIKVIYGFDGKNINEEESARERNMVNKFNSLLPGEIGVFISHLRIYQTMLIEDIPMAFIMEDDAIFCDDFLNKYNQIEKEIPSDTQLLYIGGRFNPNFTMHNCSIVSDHIVRHTTTDKWNGNDMDRTFHAYIISKDMAEICINEFYRPEIIKDAIDCWILKLSKMKSLPIYSAQPLLCHSPLVSDSDIRVHHNLSKLK